MGDDVSTRKEHVDENHATRPRRRRAKAACAECRRRKVRCDLELRGFPCTNCQVDEHECHVLASKRRKRTLDESDKTSSDVAGIYNGSPIDSSDILMQNEEFQFLTQNIGALSTARSNLGDLGASNKFESGENIANDHGDSNLSLYDALDEIFDYDYYAGSDQSDQLRASTGVSETSIDRPIGPRLPYVASISADSTWNHHPDGTDDSSIDKAFLESQGCFSFPSSTTLFRLMCTYFEHVHPNLPVVIETDVWALWPPEKEDGFDLGSFSLLVLQAMCFAASSFAPDELLRLCGFASRNGAREAFYKRAKLLHEFEVDMNHVSLAQSALLLTYYVSTANRLRKNSEWLKRAIWSAQEAFTDRSSISKEQPEKHSRVLKRLWWCVILRDRILPLGLRRSIQIASIDHSVGELTVDDFVDELGYSRIHDVATQTKIFQVVCTTCKLAEALTPGLGTLFASSNPQDRASSTSEALQVMLQEIKRNIACITDWKEHALELFPSPIGLGDTPNPVITFANLMFIYANAAIIGLCHHAMLLWEFRKFEAPSHVYEAPLPCLEDAVEDTTARVRELVQLGLIQHTPISLIAYMALPLLLHSITARAAVGTPAEASSKRQLEIFSKSMRCKLVHLADSPVQTTFLLQELKFANYILLAVAKLLADQSSTHEGATDLVYTAIERMVNLVTGKTADSPESDSTSELNAEPQMSTSRTWKELVVAEPKLYVRLAVYLDWALCTRVLPNEGDFPVELQLGRATDHDS